MMYRAACACAVSRFESCNAVVDSLVNLGVGLGWSVVDASAYSCFLLDYLRCIVCNWSTLGGNCG